MIKIDSGPTTITVERDPGDRINVILHRDGVLSVTVEAGRPPRPERDGVAPEQPRRQGGNPR